MSVEKNAFTAPSYLGLEYLTTRQRRDDLFKLCKEFLPKFPNATVLDFGSRKALYRTIFEDAGANFISADFPDDDERRDIDVVISPNGMLELADNSVDVVLSLQVLEHVPDFDAYLREAKRVLKPNGLLWLTTHGMWPYHPTPEDYNRWTLSGLKRVVGVHFSILDTYSMLGAPAYAFMIYGRIVWDLTRRLNSLQSSLLNRLMGARWGKNAPKEKRIKARYMYLGNLLFSPFAALNNFFMELAESLTSENSKRNESAFYRISGIKVTK